MTLYEPQKSLSLESLEDAIPVAQIRALRIAGAIVKNPHDAEEIVQEALIASFTNARSIEESKLDAYLNQVTRNKALDRRRSERVRRHRNIEDPTLNIHDSALANNPEATVISKETSELVQKAIQGLPLTQRQVVVLCDLNGATHVDAAAKLGMPLGTVKSFSYRAHTALRAALQDKL